MFKTPHYTEPFCRKAQRHSGSNRELPVPDGVRQVGPALVDGSGAVLDGVVQGHRAGLGQVAAGVLRVTVH